MPLATAPKALGIKDMKSKLLNPALTSLYYVTIGNPAKKLIATPIVLEDKINLMCCEASLPGSSLATLELTNDHTGVTERHAYRRVYDDRIDLTFYVESQGYGAIDYFERWIKFISQETFATSDKDRRESIQNKNAFYGFAYPEDYMDPQGFQITKFEKSSLGGGGVLNTGGNAAKSGMLTYYFVNSFPISISSMPVSYDSSSLLKCTVSMSYMRYYVKVDAGEVEVVEGMTNSSDNNPKKVVAPPADPIEQAAINSAGPGFSDNNLDLASRAALGIGEFNPNIQRNINGQIINPEVFGEPPLYP